MLSSFNRYVLIIALVSLIISITAYAYSISYSLGEYVFPPNISTCPDYWDISTNLNNTSCIYRGINPSKTDNNSNINNHNDSNIVWNSENNTITLPTTNNNKAFYCDAYEWSSNSNISWNGITNSSEINEIKCK
tara:strand:+ start:4528 stop:4929 length:402 start_codon:yes stop_codon:yes gene_type:complete